MHRAHYAAITGDKRPLYPPVMLEELTGKTVLLVGYGAIGKEIERMLAPFHVELLRVARGARSEPEVHAVERTGQSAAAGRGGGADSAVDRGDAGADRQPPAWR